MASDKVNFSDASNIAQALKHQIRSGTHWADLSPAGKEALDQIATSIGRTVSGDGVHWDAIVGFAQAARPADPPTIDIERGIRSLVRDIPSRDDHA
jgi:hypothetical protein